MFIETEVLIKKLLRVFNPDEIMIRLLKLSRLDKPADQPGLIMIQIDGLGYDQFKTALEKGQMRNMKRIVKKEGFSYGRLYPGLPSSTAAVQGELFYGVKKAIPSFSYRDSSTGKIFNMLNPESTLSVETRLREAGGEPLLKGGSVFGNMFTGGSDEAHFCVSAAGWKRFFRTASFVAFTLSILLHLHIFISLIFELILQTLIGLFVVFRSVFRLEKIGDGLRNSVIRALVCSLMKDIITIGARIDVARGLPVIHLNLVGYDEMSHLMGPKSFTAHQYLRGIDRVIGDMWKAAHSYKLRDYEFSIYSDHGQEETVYYANETGRSIQEAINSIFKNTIMSAGWRASLKAHTHYSRADLLRNRPKKIKPQPQPPADAHAAVEAIGPVGHIYPPVSLSSEEKQQLAAELVKNAAIPTVMYFDEKNRAVARDAQGSFFLPEGADRIIDRGHPFYESTAEDLKNLCLHPDSGALILLGWRKNRKPLTFYNEHGSHAGPGPEETSAFAVLSEKEIGHPWPRPITIGDLREAALRAQGRLKAGAAHPHSHKKPEGVIRVMSYNVHGCAGRDGRISPERIARVIAAHDPDIVALQELDANDAVHQAEIIAKSLSMSHHYHASVLLRHGWHGNAVLSRYDLKLIHSAGLKRLMKTRILEPRSALWVEADVDGKKVQIFTTHLSLFPGENLLQAKDILGHDWIGSPKISGHVILCGDFNATARSKTCKEIKKVLKDAHHGLKGRYGIRTFPSMYPVSKIDHIFTDSGIKTIPVCHVISRLERKASDHLPLIADLVI